MRRLKSTSFRPSGPPPEWERRFAAIVREGRAAEPAPDPEEEMLGPRQAPQAGSERAETGGWAEAWAANLRSLVAAPTPSELPTMAFDGFDPSASGREGPVTGKPRPIQRLRQRILRVSRRKWSRPPSAPPAEAPATVPLAPDAVAGARPDFPRRPANRPVRAAWLSRSDGPLRSAAPVPVAGPAIAAALVITASGVAAAYLTHRLGLEFEPAVLSASDLAAPAHAAAVTGAPLVALVPPASPVPAVEMPTAMPPAAVAPRPLGGALPAVEPAAPVPPPVPQAMPGPAVGISPAPPVLWPLSAALARPPVAPAPPVGVAAAPAVASVELPPAHAAPGSRTLASWRPGPPSAAVPDGPADLLAPLRPVFLLAPPPGTTTEAAPILPFPIESLPALGFGDLTAAAVKAAGRPEDIGAGPVAPLVPATAVAAEAITADTVDAVPQDRRPSDARLGTATRERVAATPAEAAGPRTALIAEAQRGLRRHGFDAGPADGIAGPRTEAAVRAFQRRIGQRPDGVVDPALLRDLARTPPTQVADGLPAPFGRRDPLAGLKRALADLFGLPPEGSRLSGSIASADGRGPDGDN